MEAASKAQKVAVMAAGEAHKAAHKATKAAVVAVNSAQKLGA